MPRVSSDRYGTSMPGPFMPRPAQILAIPEYLTFGLYVLAEDELEPVDEVALHKKLLGNIAAAESSRRSQLNLWKTNSRLRFEIVPAPPIVAMYEAFMPFFGVDEERQERLQNAEYLISVVTEQDMSKESDLPALRVLQTATALTAASHQGLILDPLSYKVVDYRDKQCEELLAAFSIQNPLQALLSIVQTTAESLTITSTSGLCRFTLPEIAIDKTAEHLAPQVQALTLEIAQSLVEQMSQANASGQKQINLEAPLMVRNKEIFLRLQHSQLGPVLNLNLHGRQTERLESLKSLL